MESVFLSMIFAELSVLQETAYNVIKDISLLELNVKLYSNQAQQTLAVDNGIGIINDASNAPRDSLLISSQGYAVKLTTFVHLTIKMEDA